MIDPVVFRAYYIALNWKKWWELIEDDEWLYQVPFNIKKEE